MPEGDNEREIESLCERCDGDGSVQHEGYSLPCGLCGGTGYRSTDAGPIKMFDDEPKRSWDGGGQKTIGEENKERRRRERAHTHYCDDCEEPLALLYDERESEETAVVCGHCGGCNTRSIDAEVDQ